MLLKRIFKATIFRSSHITNCKLSACLAVLFSIVMPVIAQDKNLELPAENTPCMQFETMVAERQEWQQAGALLQPWEPEDSPPVLMTEQQLQKSLSALLAQTEVQQAWRACLPELESRLITAIRATARLLYNHTNDPNYASLYGSAISTATEELWVMSNEFTPEGYHEETLARASENIDSLADSVPESPATPINAFIVAVRSRLNLLAVISNLELEPAGGDAAVAGSQIVGAVTECRPGMIKGWVYSPAHPHQPLAVIVLVNGDRFVLTANRETSGIPQLVHINDANHGFLLEYYGFSGGSNTVRILAIDPESGQQLLLAEIQTSEQQ